jgi:hypothetical protein
VAAQINRKDGDIELSSLVVDSQNDNIFFDNSMNTTKLKVNMIQSLNIKTIYY